MNENPMHIHEELLEEYLDGTINDQGRTEIEHHLDVCQSCRKEVRALRRVGESVKLLPLDGLGPAFTESVLDRLDGSSFAKGVNLVTILSGLIALVCVSGMVLAAFVMTGVISLGEIAQGNSQVHAQWVNGWNVVAGFLTNVGRWVGFRMPSPSTTTVMMTAFAGLVLFALADRFLGRRILRSQGAE
jgi:anti-sigma factor RsiW